MSRRLGTKASRVGMQKFKKDLDAVETRLREGEFYDVIADEYGISVRTVYKYFPATIIDNPPIEKINENGE